MIDDVLNRLPMLRMALSDQSDSKADLQHAHGRGALDLSHCFVRVIVPLPTFPAQESDPVYVPAKVVVVACAVAFSVSVHVRLPLAIGTAIVNVTVAPTFATVPENVPPLGWPLLRVIVAVPVSADPCCVRPTANVEDPVWSVPVPRHRPVRSNGRLIVTFSLKF